MEGKQIVYRKERISHFTFPRPKIAVQMLAHLLWILELKTYILHLHSLITNSVTHNVILILFPVVQTCHARGCHATGGMAPVVLPKNNPQLRQQITGNVCR